MKKKSHISIISILAFTVVMLAVAFSHSNLALAEEVSLVYPNEGYIQAKNVDAIGANGFVTVTADNENKVLTYFGDVNGNLDFADNTDNVVKIFVFGHSVVVKGEKGFYTADLDSDSPALISTSLFEDCYLATDGTSLFVHKSGEVAVYDQDLTLQTTYQNKIFNGSPVVTGNGEKIYAFAVDYEHDLLHVFDRENSTTSTTEHTRVYNAIMGDVIYAHNGKNITLIDPITFEIVDTELTEQNYTAFGEFLYVAKGEDGFDKYAQSNGTLTLVGNHSYNGKLNAPSSAVYVGDILVIADTLNNRLLYVGDTVDTVQLNAPTSLAVAGGRLYALTPDGIAIIENKTLIGTIKIDVVAVDIEYNNGLHILAENGVYVYARGVLNKVFDVNNGKSLEIGTLYYVLTDTAVVVAKDSENGTEFNNLLSFEIDGYTPVDIMADVVGNVYILGDDNALHCYKWQDVVLSNIEGTAVNSTDISILSSTWDFTLKSMEEMGDKIVISTEENALVSISTPLVKTKEKSSDIDKENSIVNTYASTEKSYFMTNDKDGTTAVKIDSGKTFVCYENDGALFTSYNGENGWLFNAEKLAPSTDCTGEYIANKDVKLYVNPMTDSGITLTKGTALTVVDNGGYADGNWVRVEYKGKVYYADKSCLDQKTSSKPTPEPEKPQEPEKVNKDYGRAKASRVGELVNLYSVDDSNIIVTQVADGTKLEVVEKIGDYYKVIYENNEVLIHKDQFKLEGLTTVQIIAIILSVVVVLSGGLIFMVTSLSKKKEQNQ